MDFTKTLLEVIDMRSFSNLWFWIVLAVVWSSASHYPIGIPYDLVMRARRHRGQALVDLQDLVRINVNRILHITRVAGIWLIGFVCFALTSLLILGFWFWVEFAQAVGLIALPMSGVGLLSVATAARIEADEPEGDLLFRRLARHRFWTQVIGMISIFVTAMFGMYRNISVVPGF